MRDYTGPVDTGTTFLDHGDEGPDDQLPDPADVADSPGARADADRAQTWQQGVDRCPAGHLTILPLRGDPHGRYIAVCRHDSHPGRDGWGLVGALLVSPAGTREFARARAVAHHAASGHPYAQQTPDGPAPL